MITVNSTERGFPQTWKMCSVNSPNIRGQMSSQQGKGFLLNPHNSKSGPRAAAGESPGRWLEMRSVGPTHAPESQPAFPEGSRASPKLEPWHQTTATAVLSGQVFDLQVALIFLPGLQPPASGLPWPSELWLESKSSFSRSSGCAAELTLSPLSLFLSALRNQYPRPRDTSFSGLSVEEYKLILSTGVYAQLPLPAGL